MNKIISFLIAITISFNVIAQEKTLQNVIFFEIGGNGLFTSLNFERQLQKEPGLGLRIGLGYYADIVPYLTIPVGVNYLFKLKNPKSFIEAGFGMTFAREDGVFFKKRPYTNYDHFVNYIPSVGYRRHTRHGYMWRVNLTPTFNKYTSIPWVGVAFGKRF